MRKNFIDYMVEKDLEDLKYNRVHTRFPPEPNGYLHIGSAYAINISYGLASKFDGLFNLRFDDTNPKKEDMKYVKAIEEDMEWLGFDYFKEACYGSDYSEEIYNFALKLIDKGLAYVDDLNQEEIRDFRGTLTEKGKNSPYRDRTIEENLILFKGMKSGLFKEGEKVLRAKIDMASPNMNLRDPIIYRIIMIPHYKTNDEWYIFPMYDFAHPIQDYLEGISHSLCSVEFKDHRPLYEWVLNHLDLNGHIPRQIEFGRMSVTGGVTSKRYLKRLVEEGLVDGWDDPRLLTIKGLRRRGYTPEAIKHFLNEIGVAKDNSLVDIAMLEQSLRKTLKETTKTFMGVIDPIKVTIDNLPEGQIEYIVKEMDGLERRIPFTRNLYIEREDFTLFPPKGYKRLTKDQEVRLKFAYFIKVKEVIKDREDNVIELVCTYDPKTRSGSGFKDRKVKGTIHWVSADMNVPCEIRTFDPLFLKQPTEDTLMEAVNKESVKVYKSAFIEQGYEKVRDSHFQMMRHGYFHVDEVLSNNGHLVFNKAVSLKSSFKK